MMKAVQFTLVKSECERSCQVEEKRGGGRDLRKGLKIQKQVAIMMGSYWRRQERVKGWL